MASSVSDTSSPTAHIQEPTEDDNVVESPTDEPPTNEEADDGKSRSKSANVGTAAGSKHRNPKMRLIKKREAEVHPTGDDLPTASSSSKARSPGTISAANVGLDGGVGQEADSLSANVRHRHGNVLDDQFNTESEASIPRLSETSTREVPFRGRRKTWREVFTAFLKCAIPQRKRDIPGYLFIFLGYALLYPGLFWDVISLHSADGAESRRSTYETVRFLLTGGRQYIFPGILLCFFSIFVPWLKGFLLIIGLVFGRKPRLLVFVARISKYQMVDIFVTLLLLGFLDNEIIRSNVEVGFYFFLGYCVNSIVGTTIIASGDDTAELAKKRGLTWLLLANVMIISLGCIMFLPIFRVSAVLFGKLILASSQMSLGGIMLKLFARGHIAGLMLILTTVVILPMLAYVVAPCLSIRPGAKGRIIAILHEWAMADAWLIAILVGWTSFDSNEMLKVETVPAGTYFNLLYGVTAFCIIHFCLGGKAHGIAERYSILDYDEAPVSEVQTPTPVSGITSVNSDGETGPIDRERVQTLSREMDQRNFKKKTSVVALFVLLLVPGFTLCGLIHFQAVNDVTLDWINEALDKNLASVNKAISNYSPETIGCCENPCKTDLETLPDAPVPKGTCYNVGNGALYEDNTETLYYSAARWLTDLKQITLHKARIEPIAPRKSGTKRIALIVEGGWSDRVPLSIYVRSRLPSITILDTDQRCCQPNTFKIVISAECYERYPYINHAKASVNVTDDVSIKIWIGKEIVISDIRSKIEEQVRESLITEMTESKTVPTDDGDISIEAAISRIIALNLNYGPLECPTLNGTSIPVPIDPSPTGSNLNNLLSIMASPDGQKAGDEKRKGIDKKPAKIVTEEPAKIATEEPPIKDEKPSIIDEKPSIIDEKPRIIDEEPRRNDEELVKDGQNSDTVSTDHHLAQRKIDRAVITSRKQAMEAKTVETSRKEGISNDQGDRDPDEHRGLTSWIIGMGGHLTR